jgi:hypothetical protein
MFNNLMTTASCTIEDFKPPTPSATLGSKS